jgi:hypothetical protein
MHLETHFLEFEFLDYDNVKPLKSKFSVLRFNIQNMFFDMILKCIACAWFIKSCPKPFQNATYEWNFQINFFDLLSMYFITTWQIG